MIRCQVFSTVTGVCGQPATERFAGTPMCAAHDARFRDPEGRTNLQALAALDRPLLCDNCGKPMAEHDALARCWPERIDGTECG